MQRLPRFLTQYRATLAVDSQLAGKLVEAEFAEEPVTEPRMLFQTGEVLDGKYVVKGILGSA